MSVGEQTTWRGSRASPAYCEQLGCRATDLVRGLGNDRELRARERRPRRIVEADDGDVVRDPTAELAQRAERSDRHGLVRDEQRVRRRCRLEQRASSAITAFELEVRSAHERTVDRQAGERVRVAISLQPLVRSVDPLRAGDAGDARRSVREQVSGRGFARETIVDDDGVHLRERGSTVDGDDPNAAVEQRPKVGFGR